MYDCRQLDERQVMIRGSIFKRMFLTLTVLLLVQSFLKDFGWDFLPVGGRYETLILLFTSISVGSAEMILRDVYLQRPKERIILMMMGCLSVVGLGIWIVRQIVSPGPLWEAGHLTDNGGSLTMFIALAAIPVSGLIRKLLPKEADE